jgi:hypothetical protein
MKRGLKITFLPFVFLAVRVESRFSRNVVLVESSADIVLLFGGKVRFFPVEAVVFSAAEMGYQLAFQRLEILVGNFIEQVTDSPCNMYLLCRLEIGALAAILWMMRMDGYSGVSRRAAKRCRQLSAFGHWLLKQRE